MRSCFSITVAQKHAATSCSNWHLPTARVYSRLTVKSRENTRKMPLLRNRGAKRGVYENRAYEAGKDHDIWFDEKNPIIHIRTHNTDLRKRLAAYAGQHPDQCRQTDADLETGCMEFEIRKGRFSFRLTAPYREERRRVASEAAKKNSVNGMGRSVHKNLL